MSNKRTRENATPAKTTTVAIPATVTLASQEGEAKKEKDPLEEAIKEHWGLGAYPEDLYVPHPTLLATAPLWLLYASRVNHPLTDIRTELFLDGPLVAAFRNGLVSHFPEAFGGAHQMERREALVAIFRDLMTRYFRFEQSLSHASDARKLSFHPRELIFEMEAVVNEGQRRMDEAIADRFRETSAASAETYLRMTKLGSTQRLNVTAAGLAAATEAQKTLRAAPSTPPRQASASPAPKSPSRRKRKCIRCKGGPYTPVEMQAHNMTCK